VADILTFLRIICALLILIFPAFSKWYYLFYLFGGITDAVDGVVARRLGNATAWGAKFDTVADIFFVIAVVIKTIDALVIPLWLLIWIGIIAIIKAVGVIIGFIRHHRFATVHTILNKVCGIIVFIPPLFIGGNYAWQAKALVVIFACVIASIAAVQECVYIFKGNQVE
jgi:phosphatidylglycerophosphate synthase